MFDFLVDSWVDRPSGRIGRKRLAYRVGKRFFDLVCVALLMPLVIFFGALLLLLNPFLNSGQLFFVQQRMGKDCKPFDAIKFRTMIPAREISRGPDDPIERDRIPTLGRFLRRTRIDELPQIINVLKGDMSMIGPRPDYYEHAKVYVTLIPRYAERHQIRPGITGLAQVELGYAEGKKATEAKVQKDLEYVANAGLWLDTWIALKTIRTIIMFRGT